MEQGAAASYGCFPELLSCCNARAIQVQKLQVGPRLSKYLGRGAAARPVGACDAAYPVGAYSGLVGTCSAADSFAHEK